jgi:serine/threonine protein kinase
MLLYTHNPSSFTLKDLSCWETSTNLFQQVDSIAEHYQIVKKITDTIQGAVYEANHKHTGVPVAIKVARKEAVFGKCSLAGFTVHENIFQEMTMMKQLLGIEGFVQLFDAMEDVCNFYIVTNYESGGDLFEYFVQNKPICEEEVRTIFRSICRSVQRLHKLGICHLDLSLENVFLSKAGVLKLGDFGVARFAHELREGITGRVGKPKYMAPEVAHHLPFDGFVADVFSLGIILFVLLYGTHPYQSPSDDQASFVLIDAGYIDELLALMELTGKRSRGAEILLKKMLAHQSERETIDVLLQFSWFHEN